MQCQAEEDIQTSPITKKLATLLSRTSHRLIGYEPKNVQRVVSEKPFSGPAYFRNVLSEGGFPHCRRNSDEKPSRSFRLYS